MQLTFSHSFAALVTGAAALLAWASPARAASIYATGFEDPPFANGSQLLGQDGWSTAIPPFLNPAAAVITNSVAKSGTQSVQVRGPDLATAAEVAPIFAAGSYRYPVGAAGVGLAGALVTSDVMVEGPLIGTGDFFSANIAGRVDDGTVELSISSDGKIYGYNPAVELVMSAPITLNEWHTLGIGIDLTADTYSFFVDGTSLGTFSYGAGFTADTLIRGSIVAYVNSPDSPGVQSSDFTARFDNFSISSVPEASSTGSLFLGAMALLSFRKRPKA